MGKEDSVQRRLKKSLQSSREKTIGCVWHHASIERIGLQEEEKHFTREGIDEDPEGPATCRHTECTAAERVTLKKSRNELSSSYTLPGSSSSRPCMYKPHRTAVLNGHRDNGPAAAHLGHVQGSRVHTPAITPTLHGQLLPAGYTLLPQTPHSSRPAPPCGAQGLHSTDTRELRRKKSRQTTTDSHQITKEDSMRGINEQRNYKTARKL